MNDFTRRAFRGFVIAALGLAAGCGRAETANDRVAAETPPWFRRPSGAMNVFVRRPLSIAARGIGEEYERGRAEIDVQHGRVFVGSSDHGLYALRVADASTIWRFETLSAVQSEPLYDPELDYLYFGSHDGALYAVHALDGQLVWRFYSNAEVARQPVLSGETLYFANAADNLFAVDRRTGKQIWTQHRTSALGMEVAGYAGPTVNNGTVYMAFSDGHVMAYNAKDGSDAAGWEPVDLAAQAEQSAGGETQRYLDVDTTPIVDEHPEAGRVVYVASYSGGVFALDADNGAFLWKQEKATGIHDLVLWREAAHPASPPAIVKRRPPKLLIEPQTPLVNVAGNTDASRRSGPTIETRKLLIASGTSGMWALDPQSGRMLWRVPLPEGGITQPVPVAGALMVGTTRYGLFLLSPRNGYPIDGIHTGTGFAHTPAAFGNRAYALSNGGTFVGVEIHPPALLQ